MLSPAADTRWISLADENALVAAACRRILRAADEAIAARGRFLLVLTGGQTPKAVYRQMAEIDADWAAWHFYFGDERCLPADHPDRNSRLACETWLDRVPVPKQQIHVIPAELGAVQAAARYQASLQDVADFDLVLMGLGEDGHTASLFPGQDWGLSVAAPTTLAVFDSPKPPSERVSLSGARLGRSREMLFMVTGQGKRDAVARWRAGEPLPAAAIRPPSGVDVLITPPLAETASI